MDRVHVIDSHTEGEPTRVVVSGGPDLGPGPAARRAHVFETRFDSCRSAIINEPRGADAWVGALLTEPDSPDAAAQVIFFNNVGLLGMCVHGAIGVAETLRHLGRLGSGSQILETPVGSVSVSANEAGRITVENVPSYRYLSDIEVVTQDHGVVLGDVAWGGNWFFLADSPSIDIAVDNIEELTDLSWDIRCSLERNGITGSEGAVIDHVELFGPPSRPDANSKNFVLCPGKAYDRSPCGTGTSAKMACLAADGKLAVGQIWRQESIFGSLFEGEYLPGPSGSILPRVSGRAFVTADATLLFAPDDPFNTGIRI